MKFLLLATISLFFPVCVFANGQPDSDRDGVPDADEINIFFTDPLKTDTDGDGYSDWQELNSGYSPHMAQPIRLENSDLDQDGLCDRMELKFGSKLGERDTDGDGFSDGDEIAGGFDPLFFGKEKMLKRIKVDLAKQELGYFLGQVRLGAFPVSSGLYNSTPKGRFTVSNKSPKAWSPYGLWMPYWLGLGSGRFGIHELPIWPDGRREGIDHLGRPASHGCIRVGETAAKLIYDWTPVGTEVFIY